MRWNFAFIADHWNHFSQSGIESDMYVDRKWYSMFVDRKWYVCFFDNQPLKLHSCQCWQTPFFQAKSALILVYLGKNQHHIPDQIAQNCCLSRGKSTGKYHIVDKNPGSTIMDQQWMLVNSQRISACFLRFLAPSGPSAQHGSNFRTARRKRRFRACGNDHPWINMAGKSSINRWCSLHGFGDFPRLMSQLVFIYGLRFAKFVPVKKNWKTPKRRWLKSLLKILVFETQSVEIAWNCHMSHGQYSLYGWWSSHP